VPDFPVEQPVEIARRLEIRGEDSSSWIVILTPLVDPEGALNRVRGDLSALLQKSTRVLKLADNTYKQLRSNLNEPADDIVILVAVGEFTHDKWQSIDLMRSALERKGPIIFWVSAETFAGLSEYAPNIRSFIGPSVFIAGPEGSIMTEEDRLNRLQELAHHYGQTNEEIVRKAEARELVPEPHLVEWLVLLGRGDLV
jgi:hypothetical protein